jgi:hypothetical protein
VAVTVNELAVPAVKTLLAALVMAGAWLTDNVKLWVAFGATPLLAVMVMGYAPPVLAAGVPLSTPAEVKVTPAGSVPVSLKVGAGIPVAVAVNDPAAPTLNVVVAALVMVGAWVDWTTVSVKFWVAFGVTPLLAVMVMG